MYVGTGDCPWILRFYERCGFEKSHIVKNFFTDNYDHPIYDNEVLLTDMIYLKRNL
jgi:ribosomal protein S18 acetylase RimI-like enzyme